MFNFVGTRDFSMLSILGDNISSYIKVSCVSLISAKLICQILSAILDNQII